MTPPSLHILRFLDQGYPPLDSAEKVPVMC
jgi:hypothetical protein